MSNKVSLTVILILVAILLTHLFDTNAYAQKYINEYGSKLGFNIGNYVTQTPVCPTGYTCTAQ